MRQQTWVKTVLRKNSDNHSLLPNLKNRKDLWYRGFFPVWNLHNKRFEDSLGGCVDQCLWNKQINRRNADNTEVKWMVGKSKRAVVYAHQPKHNNGHLLAAIEQCKWFDIYCTDIFQTNQWIEKLICRCINNENDQKFAGLNALFIWNLEEHVKNVKCGVFCS